MIITGNLLSAAHEQFKIKAGEVRRNWMDESSGNPYRCLPLTIGNQFGWTISCPFDFKAIWNGNNNPEDAFEIDLTNRKDYKDEKYQYSNYVSSHFGDGILTFSLPYLFKTEKKYGLMVRGPTNHVKFNITYLDAFVETDWLNFTFTYNIKFQKPNIEVEFKEGEPLLSFFPFKLEDLENVDFQFSSIHNDKNLLKNYNDYSSLRVKWNKEVGSSDWMKDYYKGDKAERKQIGCPFLNSFGKYIHFTNLKLKNPHD